MNPVYSATVKHDATEVFNDTKWAASTEKPVVQHIMPLAVNVFLNIDPIPNGGYLFKVSAFGTIVYVAKCRDRIEAGEAMRSWIAQQFDVNNLHVQQWGNRSNAKAMESVSR